MSVYRYFQGKRRARRGLSFVRDRGLLFRVWFCASHMSGISPEAARPLADTILLDTVGSQV